MAEKSNVEGVTITARGLQLIAKLTAAKMKMEFTRAKVGTGVLPDGANAYDLTHLVAYKMDGRIAGYGYDDDAKDAYVVMQISNEQIETGFVMTEAGIYAKDPDLGEILYGYLDLSEDPNYIMPAENGRFKTVQIKMHVIVGEVQEISATINPLSQVTREELQKELDKKVSIQGGDISDTVINIENPPDEDKNPVKYPEIGDSGTTKSIMGQIRRWLKSLKDDKVDKKGGDTADTVVSGLTDSTASFPQPTAGDSQKTLWGKVKKWQQDCITKFGNYVLTSMITNQHLNSTSNIPTSALVYLMQQAIQQNQNAINVLNTKQTETSNALGGKLSKADAVQYLNWDSGFKMPVITVNGQNILIPVTADTTQQFITSIKMMYHQNKWILRIGYWYNGAEHHANINADYTD